MVPMGHAHLSLIQFKIVKNRIRINLGIDLLQHYLTFYAVAYNPNFKQQILRLLWSKPRRCCVSQLPTIKSKTIFKIKILFAQKKQRQ